MDNSKVEKFNELCESFKEDIEKFNEKENASAGTRARKTLQEIKKLAHELRADIQEAKKS